MLHAITLIWKEKSIEDPDIQIAARSIGPDFIRGSAGFGISQI
jgi:hypothetical protein